METSQNEIVEFAHMHNPGYYCLKSYLTII